MVPTPALSTEVERPPRPQSRSPFHVLVMKFEGFFRVIRHRSGVPTHTYGETSSFYFLDFWWHHEDDQSEEAEGNDHDANRCYTSRNPTLYIIIYNINSLVDNDQLLHYIIGLIAFRDFQTSVNDGTEPQHPRILGHLPVTSN